jgi:ketosteroid isomerase-like protein
MYRPYGNSVPSAGSVSVDAAIREMVQDFCTAFNTGNYDQCSRSFAPDAFFMPSGHEPVQGNRLIERTLQRLGDLGYANLRQETIRVDASSDMAAEIGRYSVSIPMADGTTSVDHGKYLNCWRRLGVWRLVASCWSSSLPQITNRDQSERRPADSNDPGFAGSKKSA